MAGHRAGADSDLPLEVILPLILFVDNSQIFTTVLKYGTEVVNDDTGRAKPQRDLNITKQWADKWKMEFNVNKCKIMHLYRLNPKHTYTMSRVELFETTEEKDLGVLVDDKLDFGKHIKVIVKKVN